MTSDRLDRRLFLTQLAAFLVACSGSKGVPTGGETVKGAADSTFHRIYDDDALRARFKGFFEEVFRLYPPDALHELVAQATRTHATDAEIYAAIVAGLPDISPRARLLRLALPALKKQKKVMAGQATKLLGAPERVDGYLEIGTTGRYVNALKDQLPLEGPVFLVNSQAPSKDPADIVERGQIANVGTFVELGTYDPIASTVPDDSLDLITNFIGFHHAPVDRLEGFVTSIRRVLRPKGKLLLREHDVVDPTMDAVVSLAHDVFNAGTGVTWAENQAEIRKFRSVEQWRTYLEAHGFKVASKPEAQAGDPTDNLLVAYEKV